MIEIEEKMNKELKTLIIEEDLRKEAEVEEEAVEEEEEMKEEMNPREKSQTILKNHQKKFI